MKTKQITVENLEQLQDQLEEIKAINPQLAIAFASPDFFENPDCFNEFKKNLPECELIGCSTAGEISNDGVTEKMLVLTAVHFNKPNFKIVCSDLGGDDVESGRKLADQLNTPDLKGILVLSQGVEVNGSLLISGIKEKIKSDVLLTGGLAGDYAAFSKTYTVYNGEICSRKILGLGFFGDHIELSFGSVGGWKPFGPARKVTSYDKNILYELDGEPALEVYKKYLGEYAKDLPGSGLLFPFSILNRENEETGLIRTILGIDEEKGSLTLAGDIPHGVLLRLMHAKNDDLRDGAEKAAQDVLERPIEHNPEENSLSILISCVGRKLVMLDEIDDEVDAVKDILEGSTVCGFYSNGEICPHNAITDCKLHNQTMTVSYIKEK